MRLRYWWLLTVAASPLLFFPLYFVAGWLMFYERDPLRRGMAEINLLNETRRSLEILVLAVDDYPLRWSPEWDSSDRRWIGTSPTTEPRLVRHGAGARTPLLVPGRYGLTVTLQLTPETEPLTISAVFSIEPLTFCSIKINIHRDEIAISECQPLADIVNGYPDL
jgi:hypothetical protein